MKTDRIYFCPHCGTPNTENSGYDPNAKPKDNSISVCWRCCSAAMFQETPLGLILRTPTPEEQERLDNSAQFQRVVQIIKTATNLREAVTNFRKLANLRKEEGDDTLGLDSSY